MTAIPTITWGSGTGTLPAPLTPKASTNPAQKTFTIEGYSGAKTPNGTTRVSPDIFHGEFVRGTPLGKAPHDGWAFGDRIAYSCCYWYWMSAGKVDARFTLQVTRPPVPDPKITYAIIGDRFGAEREPPPPCPLGTPVYCQMAKPTDLTDSHIILKTVAGKEVARQDLLAVGKYTPDAWWLVEDDDVSGNTIKAGGYLGVNVMLVLTVERDPGSTVLAPLVLERG